MVAPKTGKQANCRPGLAKYFKPNHYPKSPSICIEGLYYFYGCGGAGGGGGGLGKRIWIRARRWCLCGRWCLLNDGNGGRGGGGGGLLTCKNDDSTREVKDAALANSKLKVKNAATKIIFRYFMVSD